jgi:hypothetical protein
LHPKAFGQPEERGIDFEHRAEMRESLPQAKRQPEEAASDPLEDAE